VQSFHAHFYADDSQLYMSAKPQNTADATDRLLDRMEDIGQWMASNILKLNPMKTDLLWCAASRRQHQLNWSSLVFGGATVHGEVSVDEG